MRLSRLLLPIPLALGALAAAPPDDTPAPPAPLIERVTTVAPFPRGLALVDDTLYVLCRGRVRGSGGVSAEVDDQAGTIYAVDPRRAEPLHDGPPGDAVRTNGVVLARPTSPPFKLWDRGAVPPERDRNTDRPYCTLRWHEPTQSFYSCAFSGIDRPRTPADPVAFRKNRTDAVFRFDLRTKRWYEIERHDDAAGNRYPHHDPAAAAPPHGWLEGPDNCLAVGRWLYVVAKDNSRLVRYDLAAIIDDPEAGPPSSEVVLGASIDIEGLGRQRYFGHSALAARDGWLYIGYRTSSVIVRVPLAPDGTPAEPVRGQLVAQFDPWDPAAGTSADLTDMTFDARGRLYVISAQPARIYRFTPDPERVFDARDEGATPWLDLAAATKTPDMKSENLLAAGGWLYVTSGDGYADASGATGTVYRVRVEP